MITLIEIYIIFYKKVAKYELFCNSHEIFIKKDNISSHKTLNLKIQIIPNRIKSELNDATVVREYLR